MKRSTILHLYTSYSFFLNLIYLLLELMPHPVRILVFRLLLGNLGNAPLIDYGTYFRYPKKIKIGNNVSINRGCELYAAYLAKDGTITIGSNVALGPHVKVFAGGHDYTTIEMVVTAGPVVIHDLVWIGGNSTILPGVRVGEGAVIGAGSVVTRDIPPYTVAVGNPARAIKIRELSPT
jgi:acetyltransferase-like isoleucine patch superfamily enzyme